MHEISTSMTCVRLLCKILIQRFKLFVLIMNHDCVHTSVPELYNGVGGELTVNDFDFSYMGPILKQARLNAKLTQDELAERVGVTTRYIMAIENEGRCPALDKLFKLIRTLSISADLIFYPEQNSDDNENAQLQRMI